MSKGLTAGLLLLINAGVAYTASAPDLWGAFVGLAFLSGALVCWAWKTQTYTLKEMLLLAFAFRVFFLGLPPVLSDDAYRYIWDGLLQQNGINPYAYVPEDPFLASYHTEHIYQQLNSKSFFTVYPPLSQLVFRAGASFYEYGWLHSYYAIKFILCLAEAGALLLLSQLLTTRNFLLYAWNPLILIETAGQAHTESLMLLGLVATVYFLNKGKGGWASLFLIAASMVKIYPAFLLPLLFRKVHLRYLILSSIPFVGLLIYFYTPGVINNVNSSLELYIRYFEYNAGIYYFLKEVGYLFTDTDTSKTLGPFLRYVLFVISCLIYWKAIRSKWSFEKGATFILGAILLTATTIHPWYLLGICLLATFFHPPSWHWLWAGLLSLGTYLFYVEGPYWTFVILAWGGFIVLGTQKYGPRILQHLLALRGKQKYWSIRHLLPADLKGKKILDLGAAEGYVGLAFSKNDKAHITLADVIDLNKTRLAHHQYEGESLPFTDDAFDYTLLYFVLHHCEDAETILREASRVTRGPILIVESTFTNTLEYKILYTLDVLVNRLRSFGKMQKQEKQLMFRTDEEWQHVFSDNQLSIEIVIRKGIIPHRQVAYLLRNR